MITLNSYIKRNPQLIARKINNEFILIDFNKGKFYKVNNTGEAIWKYLWKPRIIKDIKNKILDEFNVSSDRALKDTLSFINNYLDKLFSKL